MIRRIRILLRDQRGNSFVEMALVAPLLASLLIGMVDSKQALGAMPASRKTANPPLMNSVWVRAAAAMPRASTPNVMAAT